jgi:hypothetical protein
MDTVEDKEINNTVSSTKTLREEQLTLLVTGYEYITTAVP